MEVPTQLEDFGETLSEKILQFLCLGWLDL